MNGTQALGHAFWGRALLAMEWRKLCFVSYAVDPARLAVQLPPAVSLDLHEEQALVTLVLWQARYPRLLGLKLPPLFSSVEGALRFHVREGSRHGAVTVHEDSSSPFAALAARTLFGEPTRATTLRADIREDAASLHCSYELVRGGRSHRVRVVCGKARKVPERGTLAYSVGQRPYGYQRAARGELLRYDLDHPIWEAYELKEHEVDVDFGLLYGPDWAFLQGQQPAAVILAEGSEVRASLPE